MRSQFSILAVLSISASITIASEAYDPAPLKFEHPGDVFSKISHPSTCLSGVINEGNSTGEYKNISGINTYLAYPPKARGNGSDTAILYLTDIFGQQLVNNRLLADSLAKAGYTVVLPDLFNGDPVPPDAISNPALGYNLTEWRTRHTTAMVDALVATSIQSIRNELGFKKVAAVGYCFGGKYVARFLALGKGIDAGFTAHPSAVEAAEWQGIAGPLSIAFGDLDGSSTPAQRAAAEAIFLAKNATYQTVLYANAEHGWAVRTNLTDPKKRFAQESAYLQAVRWFDAWI
ncbi:Alpha/Beta hydrolase protein [Tricladium varicosporioides]|nr:Alpha/Beta hydrolase protein [Hymenoscyphus varicosporioides]